MLDLIQKIYASPHFMKIFIYTLLFLVLAFFLVLFLGKWDARKEKKKLEKKKKEEDISFDDVIHLEELNSDVTLEMPSLTKNLEDFKKNIEEAMQNEELSSYEVIKHKKRETIKKNKILDREKIENTSLRIHTKENSKEEQ